MLTLYAGDPVRLSVALTWRDNTGAVDTSTDISGYVFRLYAKSSVDLPDELAELQLDADDITVSGRTATVVISRDDWLDRNLWTETTWLEVELSGGPSLSAMQVLARDYWKILPRIFRGS